MTFLDASKSVIGILENERQALLHEDCSITSKNTNNVLVAYQLVCSKPGKNTPKRRAHAFLSAVMAGSKELFVLSAFAATNGLISAYNVRSTFVVDEVQRWWEMIDIPPKLATFSDAFFDKRRRFTEPSQVIVDRLFPDRDTETLLSLSREQLISLLTSPGLSSSDLEPSSLQTRLQNGPEVEGERTTKRRRLSIDHEHPEQSAATDDFEPGPGRVIQPPNLWLQDSAMASTQSFELGGLQNDLNDGTQHGLQAVQTGKEPGRLVTVQSRRPEIEFAFSQTPIEKLPLLRDLVFKGIESSQLYAEERRRREPRTGCITVFVRPKNADGSIIITTGSDACYEMRNALGLNALNLEELGPR